MRGFESGLEALEGSYGEGSFELGEAFESSAGGRVFDEVTEMELAGALLGVSSEEEMDRFLGSLIQRAGRAVGGFVRSPVGQALGGILKNAARQALPVVGGAIGSAIGGASGGAIGSQLATTAGRVFGLELEGLSQEDQEYETARRFVRFAAAAAANAAQTPPTGSPSTTAQGAAVAAARQHAPGLLGGRRTGGPGHTGWRARHGRWIRRGRTIVIVNCDIPRPSPAA